MIIKKATRTTAMRAFVRQATGLDTGVSSSSGKRGVLNRLLSVHGKGRRLRC
jgi:hypothetical protein